MESEICFCQGSHGHCAPSVALWTPFVSHNSLCVFSFFFKSKIQCLFDFSLMRFPPFIRNFRRPGPQIEDGSSENRSKMMASGEQNFSCTTYKKIHFQTKTTPHFEVSNGAVLALLGGGQDEVSARSLFQPATFLAAGRWTPSLSPFSGVVKEALVSKSWFANLACTDASHPAPKPAQMQRTFPGSAGKIEHFFPSTTPESLEILRKHVILPKNFNPKPQLEGPPTPQISTVSGCLMGDIFWAFSQFYSRTMWAPKSFLSMVSVLP